MRPELAGLPVLKAAAAEHKLALTGNPSRGEGEPAAFVVFDASGMASATQLRELYDFMQPQVSQLPACSRVLLVSRTPAVLGSPVAAAAAAALHGFVRSLGKEIGRNGSTANVIEVGARGEAALAGAVRFLLSPHAAFISGQILRVDAAGSAPDDWVSTLAGKTAVVTGAARGIGAAIAEVLAREGAKVIGVDRPQEEGELGKTLAAIGGIGLALDVTADDAPQRLAAQLSETGGADIIVHNAGITRDKMLRNMPPHWWDQVLAVNLDAILRINEKLLQQGLNEGARMVCVASIGGISGNAGQTNYGATKAGVIGYCAALAEAMAERGGAVNAVAPGFIETQMTAAMPTMMREFGRRLNSLKQGGLPVDIAEAVTFLASPYAAGVNGQTLRVCGQNWFGA